MIRVFLIVVALGLLLAAAGLGYLGLFPPHPAVHSVTVVLPATGFKG